ncbi:MAG: 3-hydroxyacyl-CoA dehydrogenase family protein [Gemmataceae bacterium]
MAFFQGEYLWVNQLSEGVADLHFGGKDEASLLHLTLLEELHKALAAIDAAKVFRLVLVHLGKAARASLSLDLALLSEKTSAEAWRELAEAEQKAARALATFRLPCVAMIAGACLGAELALALACDYRIVVEKAGGVLGFPELEWGLAPVSGVSHRLPRLIGLEPALRFLYDGKRLRPTEAQAIGLVDAVMGEGGGDPPDFLANPQKRQPTKLPKRTWRQWLVESLRPGRWLLFKGARRLVRRRFPADMPGPGLMLETIQAGLKQGADAAETKEADALAELGQTATWRNLLHLYQEREAIRGAYLRPERKDRLRRVGILGVAGRGAALAVLAGTHNCQVFLQEKDELSLGLGLMFLINLFKQEMTRSGLNQADMERNLNAVKASTNYRDFQTLDVALLAADEPIEKAAEALRKLEQKISAECLIVSTDPALPVRELAAALEKPQRLAALHFQAPAGRALLVEVVPSSTMPQESVRRLLEWVAQLGRTPRRAPDGPGFLFNRLLVPYLLEAILLAEEAIRVERVDEAMTAFGMAHGPLEHIDLMGVDQVVRLAAALAPTWEERLPANDVLPYMLQQGWFGQRTSVGFYRYGRRRRVHQRLRSLLLERGRRERREHLDVLSVEDQRRKVTERLVFLWINEAARCLEQGLVSDAEELDLTLALGGWAPQHGGPLTYARSLGKEQVLQTLERLATRQGERYRASPWLERGLQE